MVLSVSGPLNNIWGPGLAFEAFTTLPISVGSTDRCHVFFWVGATESPLEYVGEASALWRGDSSATLTIGQTTIPDIGAFRAGQSAGGEVHLTIHHYNPASQDVEPPQVLGPVTWDPALHLDTLLKGGSGGGLTPEQANQLAVIFNSVRAPMSNHP